MTTSTLKRLAQPLGFVVLLNVATLASPAQALQFTPAPDQEAPHQTTGGASRNTIHFVPVPGQDAPRESTGGASRGEFNFIPSTDSEAPSQASGGASRGQVNFIPAPGQDNPRRADSGASRGEFNFIPSTDSEAPSQASGGASRGEFNFIPHPETGRPEQSRSGASRGQGEVQFTPDEQSGSPEQGASGSSRGGQDAAHPDFMETSEGSTPTSIGFIPSPDSATPQRSVSGTTRRSHLPEAIYLLPSSVRNNSHGNHNAFDQNQLPAGMLALMPDAFYGLTVSGHPTFFFYLPESAAQGGVFRLKNQAGELLYEQDLPNAHRAGIIALQLPPHLPELAVGHNYHWYVALKFDEQLVPASPFVEAMISRVAPSATVAEAATTGNILNYASALAAEGIWYDTMATLNALRVAQPAAPELEAHWQELLSSVGLDEVAQSPLIIYAAGLSTR